MIEGHEVIYPAIPPEFRNTLPDTLAFLQLLGDFNIKRISAGHLIIKTALYEGLIKPDFLTRSDGFIYLRIAQLQRISAIEAEKKLKFALEQLWESCDAQRIDRIYGLGGSFSDYCDKSPIEKLRLLSAMFLKQYKRYEG